MTWWQQTQERSDVAVIDLTFGSDSDRM
jgi:hypothetical protein